MSEPDIYTIKLTGYPEDHYVLWRDYEKLKDELARLRASSFVTAVPVEQYERIVKAGDAMASSIQFNEETAKDYNGPTIVHQSVKAWNAAKEGKPSV